MYKARILLSIEAALIVLATLLCFSIALYNRGANDNHLEVGQLLRQWIDSGIKPDRMESCRECFHPKLFHFSAALLDQITSSLALNSIAITNILNFLCWFISNLVITSLIAEKFQISLLRLALIAFCWFNPSVLTVGAQATNDAFAMLFGTIALRFISWHKLRCGFYIWSSTLLAVFSKGTALVLLFLVFCRSTIALVINSRNLNYYSRTAVFTLSLILLLLPFYLPQKISTFSFLFASSMAPANGSMLNFHFKPNPYPPFYASRDQCRQQPEHICSVIDGFFTFRIVDLVLTPKIPRSKNSVMPRHTQSVWTTVYARYFLPVFPQHFWRDESPLMDQISRSLAVLGLYPLLLMLIGLIKAFIFNPLKKSFWIGFITGQSIFHLAIVIGLLAMLTVFNLSYRWNPGFKEIYLYCGLFSFWFLFLDGLKIILLKFRCLNFFTSISLLIISFLWLTGLTKILYGLI